MENFYDDLKPMVHYVPATLENLSETVAMVMDQNNDKQMKSVVKSANLWCKRSFTESAMAKDAIKQLKAYKTALDAYNSNWQDDWMRVKDRFFRTVDDLVDCHVWSPEDCRWRIFGTCIYYDLH